MKVLVTGGAGFIGSHLSKRLLEQGCEVTVFDNFSPQIHGRSRRLPLGLGKNVRLLSGDVKDGQSFTAALKGQEVVVHLAAETGTGQSMYEVRRYEESNIRGTALLMDWLVNAKASKIRKIVTASSRAIYGEGKYQCREHGVVFPRKRRVEDLKAGRFEPCCPRCGLPCLSLPTDEDSILQPSSFYGITKQVQEQMTLLFGGARGIPAAALRFQNVYGPGQSLKNPYTGILAIFSNQARKGKPIFIFEDGLESRDFVYIDDVVDAIWRCVRDEFQGVEAFNVGMGNSVTVSQVVKEINSFFGDKSKVEITGQFRDGDIRHNRADLSKAVRVLCYSPKTPFPEGIRNFLSWASEQDVGPSRYENSLREMRKKGLMHG